MASGAKELQVALRQPLDEAFELRLGDVGGQLGREPVEAGLVALDALVAVALRQVVVGVDVEPPQQLFLPRRQRVRADRADVGQRHEAQHLQPVLGADEVGELLDDVRVLGVAAERDQRHPEVVADEEQHRVARLAGDLQPGQARPRPCARSRPRDRRRATCRRRAAAATAPAAPGAGSPASTFAKRWRPGSTSPVSRSRLRMVSSVCSSTVYLW